MSASPVPVQGPPVLPGYRCLQHLGAGGNSQVYLYEQDMPRRKVAVKVLNEAGLTDAARRQFTAEANAMASLADHPHIVQVFTAAVTADGRPYLVMQYFPRPNLNVRARREHFPVAEVLRTGIQIGSAVETCHRTGILHRDIKPANILTGQFGTPALTDFGIAARKGSAGAEGMSVPWSPPEVLYGTSDGDERSDVYSLGATLWHLLGGRSPFEQSGGDNSTLALMRRIQSEPPPRTQRQDVPESLERLLRQAMAKDPAQRPPTALAFVRALQAVEQEQRLPLTQIVLAADDPPPPGAPADDAEATVVRGARRLDMRPPTDRRPPTDLGSPTPMMPPGAADTTHIRGAAVLDPRRADVGPRHAAFDPRHQAAAASVPRRHRQLSAEPREASTLARPVLARPDAALPSAPQGPRDGGAAHRVRSPRLIAVAVGGLLVVAAAGVALVLSGHPGSPAASTSSDATQTSQNALGPGASVPGASSTPGTPAVTVAQAGRDVSFRWTYANHAAGDIFRWQRVNGGTVPRAGTTTKPALLVADSAGQSVCITVQVVRSDGSSDSAVSTPVCS